MYNNEIKITVGSASASAFLQDGFYILSDYSKKLHKHSHTELQIIVSGVARLKCGKEELFLSAGSLVVIPPSVIHRFEKAERVQYIAFQTDFEAKSLAVYPLAEGVADELKREIAAAEKSGNYSRICAYLALFCSYYSEEKTAAVKIGDYSYLIREFFTENYAKELTLSQLARELRTSVRQAERLVRRYTGRSFCDELLYTRMAMADALMKDTDMSLREIAECVGYGSYSGFWKARKRYDERKGK